jgi:hypothetical protein
MTISEADYKILWERAAGRCSNPGCGEDLTAILARPGAYHIGEMAHMIAKKPSGPRGGSDTYENLMLLCPTCHRRVDKAPAGEYPEGLLQQWKRNHEEQICNLGRNKKFESLAALKKAVTNILNENHILWRSVGPESRPPDVIHDQIFTLSGTYVKVIRSHLIINA